MGKSVDEGPQVENLRSMTFCVSGLGSCSLWGGEFLKNV